MTHQNTAASLVVTGLDEGPEGYYKACTQSDVGLSFDFFRPASSRNLWIAASFTHSFEPVP